MRILLVFPHHMDVSWSTPLSIYHELVRQSHEVEICSVWDYQKQYTDKYIDGFTENKYDFVLNMDYGQFPIPKLHRDNFKHGKDIVFVVECGDDPQQFIPNYSKLLKQSCDIILTPDSLAYQSYHMHMAHKPGNIYALPDKPDVVWWTQFADDVVFRRKNIPITCDIATTCGYRGDMSEPNWWSVHGINFQNKIGLEAEEHNEFLQSGLFVFQQSRHNEITRRVFEGMACGKPVITDRLPMVTRFHELFTDNVDILLYSNELEALDKVKYYQQHQGELEVIAHRGLEKVLNEHTQRSRVAQLIEAVVNRKNA